VRRQLDFPSGAGDGDGNMDDDEDDDFLFRAAEEMERSLHERRATQDLPPPPPPVGLAPPTFPQKECICRRGPCDVEWKEPGGWTYVCSATPVKRPPSPPPRSSVGHNLDYLFWG
jgi:hypothetical protein